MTPPKPGPRNGTVTDSGNLFLAFELHAERDKHRDQLRHLPEHLLEKLHPAKPESDEHPDANGFAPQPLIDKLASAALFDCPAPILVRHALPGALSQFFRCRFLAYLGKTVAWRGLATISGSEAGPAKEVLARALAGLFPELDARELGLVPLNDWARTIRRSSGDAAPQRVLVIEHFEDFSGKADRAVFQQLLRRLARIGGFSVIVGEVDSSSRHLPFGWTRWARPFRVGGVLDLRTRAWTQPRCSRFGPRLDRFYVLAGEGLDLLRRRLIKQSPLSPAARAATASTLVMLALTLVS